MKIPVEQAEAELAAITALVRHPGWAVLCARFDKGVQELTDSVFDPNTEDETATRLRHARAVVLSLSPATLAKEIETTRASILRKAAPPTDGANRSPQT